MKKYIKVLSNKERELRIKELKKDRKKRLEIISGLERLNNDL